jgi:TPP-dependent pyruvate/acetoin dehydrogenase alpha subunit
MFQIRRFEEMVLEKFPTGVFYGTTHTYIGQEADAAGVLDLLHQGDIVFSNHRGHGHFLAYGGDPRALLAELMGKSTGVSGGRGGSQHLHWRNFYSNGIQGGIVPTAVGMALAEKYQQSGVVTVVFMGDGTLGEGVTYEALNLASLWQAPILFVLENNRIAQTTPIEQAVAGSISGRFAAFGLPVNELESSDVLEIRAAAEDAFRAIRTEGRPQALLLHTWRFGPHSKGDDTRPEAEIQRLRQDHDPLQIHAPRLAPADRQQIEAQVNQTLQAAFHQAAADPFPA